MDETAREKGLKLFAEIYGQDMADGLVAHMQSDSAFGSKQAEWTLDFPFGSIWSREGMERRMRSAAVLGMLISQRQTDEIRFHTRMALKNGLTRTELEEIFYTALAYCGFPAAQSGKAAMLDVLRELGLENEA